MQLINKVKDIFSNTKDNEADFELQYQHLLDNTYEQNCKNVISRTSGKGSWRSVEAKLRSFRNDLQTTNKQDYYFSFTGMEEEGITMFFEYLKAGYDGEIWRKFLEGHNDTDEYRLDIRNIYRRKIFYHKFSRLLKGTNLFASEKLAGRTLFKIINNKTGFALNMGEIDLIEHAMENSLSETEFRELLQSGKHVDAEFELLTN